MYRTSKNKGLNAFPWAAAISAFGSASSAVTTGVFNSKIGKINAKSAANTNATNERLNTMNANLQKELQAFNLQRAKIKENITNSQNATDLALANANKRGQSQTTNKYLIAGGIALILLLTGVYVITKNKS